MDTRTEARRPPADPRAAVPVRSGHGPARRVRPARHHEQPARGATTRAGCSSSSPATSSWRRCSSGKGAGRRDRLRRRLRHAARAAGGRRRSRRATSTRCSSRTPAGGWPPKAGACETVDSRHPHRSGAARRLRRRLLARRVRAHPAGTGRRVRPATSPDRVTRTGVAIIGSPSLQSQAYASEGSKAGHVNCKDGKEYKRVMERHFENVFLFSMNDEVVHTGFTPMAHYLFALCVGRGGEFSLVTRVSPTRGRRRSRHGRRRRRVQETVPRARN